MDVEDFTVPLWRAGAEAAPVRVGISACLLGDTVRYTGGHAHDTLLDLTFSPHFQWVPVCPEVEVGMGVPRETVRLEGDPRAPRMRAPKSGHDWTDPMRAYAKERAAGLAAAGLDGYILKKGSPSCGLERVRVHLGEDRVAHQGRGLFAQALVQAIPHLPVEEEGRLRALVLRENFIERVYARHAWRVFLAQGPAPDALVAWHTRHKLALRAHSATRARVLGQLVARAGRVPMSELLPRYEDVFLECLEAPATVKRHADVLYHILGYLRGILSAADREDLAAAVESFRRGEVPLAVPLALLGHHLKRHPVPWLAGQTYLEPYPPELRLRAQLLEPRSDHLGG